MSDLTNNKHFAKLLLGLNERFDVRPPTQRPDLERLRAAIKASQKRMVKSQPLKTRSDIRPPHDLYITHTPNPEIFSGENFDYRKSDPPLYSSNNEDLNESEILERLNQLLQENEISGLDTAQMKETASLLKKVKR